MRDHFRHVVDIAAYLRTERIVLGSPKNRLRGRRSESEARKLFAEFLSPLLSFLETHSILLMLEPNAPAYGADFLTTYSDVVEMADLIGSPFVQPQIDTGCLQLVDEDPLRCFSERPPHHVHFSAPGLEFPRDRNFAESLRATLEESGYSDWLVLEVLASKSFSSQSDFRWFLEFFGARS